MINELPVIIDQIKGDETIVRWSKQGWCRMWVKNVLDLLEREAIVGVVVLAKEVELSPGYWHSYISLVEEDCDEVILNGSAYMSTPEYFGVIEEAPEIFKSGKVDVLIMNDRK